MSMIGKSLIHYEITSEIGRGGMGEVYQAKDTRLERDVAIKVLPEEFALDTDRVKRFQVWLGDRSTHHNPSERRSLCLTDTLARFCTQI